MSRWTHAICKTCYGLKEPGRMAVVVIDAEPERCCFCGDQTKDGIYYRADPETTRCEGEHEEGVAVG